MVSRKKEDQTRVGTELHAGFIPTLQTTGQGQQQSAENGVNEEPGRALTPVSKDHSGERRLRGH